MKTKFFYRGLFDKMQKKMVQTHNYHYTTQNFLQRMKNTINTKKIILMFITWAIFTTLCLDVLLKIFYHYWHKKTSKKTVEQYKSDQTFALIQNDTKCWMFGISKFREHRLELFRMLYTLGYFNYIQYCVLFLHLNRVLMKWKDD